VSSKTIQAQVPAAKIGDISELNGVAGVIRDKEYEASLSFAIQQDDQAITRNGRLAITFLDDSKVSLTEHSKLLITKYIFDPDPTKAELGIDFALGTARFVTGKFNKIAKQNIKLTTPTANIAIRGTSFTTTVDELGRSLIILLPDEFGLSSGEITVTTAAGTVTLTRPFEATTVNVFESAPTKPVILDLSLDIIDNMLIVSPPKEDELFAEEESVRSEGNILDFNELDIDYLAEDLLKEDFLEFTELDINYLDVNFLEDLLDIIDALEIAKEEDALQLATSTVITGTQLGQDPDTQIISIIDGEFITLTRQVQQIASIRLNVDQSYTVIFIQDGVSKTIKINGGASSTITIRQSAG
tara:strand:+ start:4113 stop:5183 length:1071 start_codon:yes stop_codon:yes gene_type:complete